MAGGYDNEDRQAELEELRREKEREARERLDAERAASLRNPYETPDESKPMAPDPKLNVKRADDDKATQDKLAMLKELAKMTKPTGPSSRDEEEKS
ncbi:MAG: hypothetical protein ABR562_05485 [Thermoplasmatota archaeon]|nr:hypothetical protein [Halobacteriales archaeon]